MDCHDLKTQFDDFQRTLPDEATFNHHAALALLGGPMTYDNIKIHLPLNM